MDLFVPLGFGQRALIVAPPKAGKTTILRQIASAVLANHTQARLFLGLALGSMGASAILNILGKDEWALFVGQWAAPFLIMGNYNKMVKQHGSDALGRSAA